MHSPERCGKIFSEFLSPACILCWTAASDEDKRPSADGLQTAPSRAHSTADGDKALQCTFLLCTSKERLYEEDQFPRGLRPRCRSVPAHCSQGRACRATQVRGGEVLWGRQSRQERLPDGELVVRRDLEER